MENLKELEKTGKYVFHGSPDEIEVLEVRQPYTFDKEKNKMVEDGEPTVAATPYTDIAIFRAIVNGKNISGQHWSGFGYDGQKKKLEFRMSVSTAERAKGKSGFVHVLDKKNFAPRNPDRPEGMEWRSSKSVKPVQVIKVTSDDLPKDIDIEPDPFGSK